MLDIIDLKKRLAIRIAKEDVEVGRVRTKEEFVQELQKRLAAKGVGDA